MNDTVATEDQKQPVVRDELEARKSDRGSGRRTSSDSMRASGGRGSTILGRLHSPRRIKMTQPERSALTSAALDYDTTIIGALELSEKKWVLAVQLPGVKRHTRHVLGASGEELAQLIERLKARCVVTGHPLPCQYRVQCLNIFRPICDREDRGPTQNAAHFHDFWSADHG
jgi:hypothetical protein